LEHERLERYTGVHETQMEHGAKDTIRDEGHDTQERSWGARGTRDTREVMFFFLASVDEQQT
jgi:hypothetical protein